MWERLTQDLDLHIQRGNVSNMHIFYVLRALSAVNLLNDEIATGLIEYLVKRGYDADDLTKLSSQKGSYRRAV